MATIAGYDTNYEPVQGHSKEILKAGILHIIQKHQLKKYTKIPANTLPHITWP